MITYATSTTTGNDMCPYCGNPCTGSGTLCTSDVMDKSIQVITVSRGERPMNHVGLVAPRFREERETHPRYQNEAPRSVRPGFRKGRR